ILHEKNFFGTLQFFCERMLLLDRYRADMKGKINLKGGALAGGAVHPDVPVTLFHDAVDGCQAQARALATLFRGKERLENVRQDSRGHSRARVNNRKADVISNAGAWMSTRISLVQLCVGGVDLQFAAVRHGIARIDR